MDRLSYCLTQFVPAHVMKGMKETLAILPRRQILTILVLWQTIAMVTDKPVIHQREHVFVMQQMGSLRMSLCLRQPTESALVRCQNVQQTMTACMIKRASKVIVTANLLLAIFV